MPGRRGKGLDYECVEEAVMCDDCWKRYYDSATSSDPCVIRASEAIREVYDYHLSGGGLHIVIDDWNLDDGSIEFCKDHIEATGYDAEPDRLEAERDCITALTELTEMERAAALALYEGFYTL